MTQYATQVNRQKLNEVMDALQKADRDVNTLFNIWGILTQHLRYQQIYTYACTILAYFRDSLTNMRQIWAVTNILSPNILPVEELRNMLRHIESQLPSTMHLPISLDDSILFYQYSKTHMLTAARQVLLITDIPKTEHNCSKYMIFSTYKSHTLTSQPSRKSTTNK